MKGWVDPEEYEFYRDPGSAIEKLLAEIGSIRQQINQHNDMVEVLHLGRKLIEQLLTIGDCYLYIPSVTQALEHYRDAYNYLDILKQQEELYRYRSKKADILLRLGVTYGFSGSLKESKEHCLEAISIWNDIRHENPNGLSSAMQDALAKGYMNLGDVQRYEGHFGEALDSYYQAIRLWESLDPENPKFVGSITETLSMSYIAAGNLEWFEGNMNGARAAYRCAIDNLEKMRDRLGYQFPVTASFHLAKAYLARGDLPWLDDQFDQVASMADIQASIGIMEDIKQTHSPALREQLNLAYEARSRLSELSENE